MVRFFFDDVVFDEPSFTKTIGNDAVGRELLVMAIGSFATVDWTASALHDLTLALGESLGLALRKSQAPIRCAVTGTSVGPPLFESLEILGREVTLRRLREALERVVA